MDEVFSRCLHAAASVLPAVAVCYQVLCPVGARWRAQAKAAFPACDLQVGLAEPTSGSGYQMRAHVRKCLQIMGLETSSLLQI